MPPWTRIYRIQRDIPMPLVSSGVEKGNLRELALARMARLGLRCRDVRTREVGIQDIHHKVKPDEVELVRRDYAANDGWETFLAYEDPAQDILVGLLRLRQLCSDARERQAGLQGVRAFASVAAACAAMAVVLSTVRQTTSRTASSSQNVCARIVAHRFLRYRHVSVRLMFSLRCRSGVDGAGAARIWRGSSGARARGGTLPAPGLRHAAHARC